MSPGAGANLRGHSRQSLHRQSSLMVPPLPLAGVSVPTAEAPTVEHLSGPVSPPRPQSMPDWGQLLSLLTLSWTTVGFGDQQRPGVCR